MKNNRMYVFFGGWSSYTLNPLYVYMKEQGYSCVEITPDTCSDMKMALLTLSAKEFVFITSAHFCVDETHIDFQNTPYTLSALEAMDILRPVKSVYYPHDLTELNYEFDSPWLNSVVDIILCPIDGYAHLSCYGKLICNVGWIKKKNKIGKGIRFQVGHGFSELNYYKNIFGFDKMYAKFRDIWEQGVTVKIPSWGKFQEEYYNFFIQNNINYIDSSRSIFELIETCEIMLTNAITSVNIESALSGRFTINMLDGLIMPEEQKKYFDGLPNLEVMTVSDTVELIKEYYRGDFIPRQGEDVLKHFDFKRAVELITM